MFLVGVHPIRDIRDIRQSQDAESQLNAKSQEVGTLSAKAEAKTGKQQALLPGATGEPRGHGFVWSKYSKKHGEILNLELISERFGVSSLMLHSWLVSVLWT